MMYTLCSTPEKKSTPIQVGEDLQKPILKVCLLSPLSALFHGQPAGMSVMLRAITSDMMNGFVYIIYH